jgi:hypothetical protein
VKPLPYLHVMPRVNRDIEKCVDFVGRQPWGKPDDREADTYRGIERACVQPEASRVEVCNGQSGIGLRRRKAAQFVIVYTYLPSRDPNLPGVVSVRAVRYSRTKNVFSGVKEPSAQYTLCGCCMRLSRRPERPRIVNSTSLESARKK